MMKKREKTMNNYEKERKKQRTMMKKREQPLKHDEKKRKNNEK
jgi:hypothetical protein